MCSAKARADSTGLWWGGAVQTACSRPGSDSEELITWAAIPLMSRRLARKGAAPLLAEEASAGR